MVKVKLALKVAARRGAWRALFASSFKLLKVLCKKAASPPLFNVLILSCEQMAPSLYSGRHERGLRPRDGLKRDASRLFTRLWEAPRVS
jgi:hypothetical protein